MTAISRMLNLGHAVSLHTTIKTCITRCCYCLGVTSLTTRTAGT